MVSLTEREAIVQRALDDAELRPVQIFIFGGKPDVPSSVHTPDLVLLAAISRKDADAFRAQVLDLERRRISPESAWCDNDCLVFCLLLGCEMFGIESPVIEAVLSKREQNRNVILMRVNEVFRALHRKEHAFVEEFSFIKIPYDHLRGDLRLAGENAPKIYQTLVKPKFLDGFSPFITLLAIRAYDLIITARKPASFEDFPQLLAGLEKLGDKISIRQVSQVLLAMLSMKNLFVIAGLILTVVCTVFGIGMSTQRLVTSRLWLAVRPPGLKIASIRDAQHLDDKLLDPLSASLFASHQSPVDKKTLVLLIEADPVGSATLKYSIELFPRHMRIIDGYAFQTKYLDGDVQRAFLPARIVGETMKVFLPADDGTSGTVFLLLVEAPVALDVAAVNNDFVVRVLD